MITSRHTLHPVRCSRPRTWLQARARRPEGTPLQMLTAKKKAICSSSAA